MYIQLLVLVDLIVRNLRCHNTILSHWRRCKDLLLLYCLLLWLRKRRLVNVQCGITNSVWRSRTCDWTTAYWSRATLYRSTKWWLIYSLRLYQMNTPRLSSLCSWLGSYTLMTWLNLLCLLSCRLWSVNTWLRSILLKFLLLNLLVRLRTNLFNLKWWIASNLP